MIDKLLPAIKKKCPGKSSSLIKVQQDNAKPHINPDDKEFKKAVKKIGLNLQIVQQPANSPYLNVLDLGYFTAIQSLQNQDSPQNIDELISEVYVSFECFHWSKLNDIFLTLQKVMKIIKQFILYIHKEIN